MHIKSIEKFDFDQLKTLYKDAGWKAYLKDDTAFRTMFHASYDVYGAYDNSQLVGVIRAISDKAHILYIQDLLVLTSHRRRGIGKALLNHMVAANQKIRQKVLITDLDDLNAQAFYEACGFKKATDNSVKCYIRFD